MLEVRDQQVVHETPAREWIQPDGLVWLQFYRARQGYLLRFPDLADFEINGKELAVTCHPMAGVSGDTTRHLFLNQVVPLVLSKRGKLVFHASAVAVDGAAAAFVADAGAGKSTLAASFAGNGFKFMCDDGLVLQEMEGGFQVMPSHPSIRLWSDSHEAVVGKRAATAPPVQDKRKVRVRAGEGIVFCDQPRPLRRVYFLGDGNSPALTLQRLSATAAVAEWIKHAFLLDLEEKALLTSHFERLIVLASRVACYRLDYPRNFAALGAVRQAIVSHLCDAREAA